MKTKIARQIRFNKMDRIHIDKTIDMLVDMCNVMLDAVDVGDEFDSITNIDMIDANSGEVIAIRSELEDCAMMLADLWRYMEDSIDKDINVECHENGKVKVDSMF